MSGGRPGTIVVAELGRWLFGPEQGEDSAQARQRLAAYCGGMACKTENCRVEVVSGSYEGMVESVARGDLIVLLPEPTNCICTDWDA